MKFRNPHKKIKLLYALGCNSGGALKNVIDLATHLDLQKFEIYIALSGKNQIPETQIAISKIEKKKINIHYIDIPETISPADLISLVKISSYLKKNKFDIVHAHSSKAGALFRLGAFIAKVPIVMYTPHCFYFTAFTGCKRYFYQLLEQFLVRFTHHFVISGTEKKAARNCHIEDKDITIIDNGIDISEYEKKYCSSGIRNQLDIPSDHRIIVGVGRLVKQKNWEMFIKAAQAVLLKNKKITFLIAGEGPLKKQLKKQINAYGLESQIKLIGYIENISIVYTIADLFISTSRWEGLPYTYLEALYFDVPMIITQTEGIEYFTEKGKQIYISKLDSYYLASKILEFITSLSGNYSLSDKYPFPLTKSIKQYEKLYHTLYFSYTKQK